MADQTKFVNIRFIISFSEKAVTHSHAFPLVGPSSVLNGLVFTIFENLFRLASTALVGGTEFGAIHLRFQ